MKKIILTFSLIAITGLTYSQGLILDAAKYKNIDQWIPPEKLGFSTSALPVKISYRKYCPSPQIQRGATCVGWSAAYAAYSTQSNIQMNITKINHKWARAFDPNFVYNVIKDENDYDCTKGTALYNAFSTLKKYGCKPLIWEPWLNCTDTNTFKKFTFDLASYYKIIEFYSSNMENIIESTKKALYSERLVVIGVNLTESFMTGSSLHYGQWSPTTNEPTTGGHAMCVIGYDDTKFGGAFEIMNSYGSDFGDRGFIWINYKDFAAKVGEAYIFDTQEYKTTNCSFGDCLNSYSRFKFNNGDVYEGIIKNAELDIYGAYLFNDGSIYIGDWKTGRKHGFGLLYDEPTRKFYSTYYQNDVLTEHKSLGFAMSASEKKSIDKLAEIKKTLPGELSDENDFDTTQKALSKYEAPDKPITVKVDIRPADKPIKSTPKNIQKKPAK